jgi:hypothetical protein
MARYAIQSAESLDEFAMSHDFVLLDWHLINVFNSKVEVVIGWT